mgnify:CR=1 FL=1
MSVTKLVRLWIIPLLLLFYHSLRNYKTSQLTPLFLYLSYVKKKKTAYFAILAVFLKNCNILVYSVIVKLLPFDVVASKL